MSKVHKTNAMRILDAQHIPYDVVEYAHGKNDPVDGISVAASLQEPEEKVFKTLVCQASTKEFLVFMIPVAEELDLKKCAKAAGVKNLDLLPLKDLTKVTGYIRGGCSPIGMKKAFRTFVDESVNALEDFYFSAGKIGMQIHAAPADILPAVQILSADLCRK